MSFAETRFPVDVSYGSAGGPEFSTDIVITHSGHEQRNSNWAEARLRFNVAYGVRSAEQLAEVVAFFRARKGQAEGFRYKDWGDYQGVAEVIGTGNGSSTQFQLVKHYVSGATQKQRLIAKPVAGTVHAYVNGEAASIVAVNTGTGIITLASAPANGTTITADFEFDVPVRFATDRLSASLDNYGVYSVKKLPLVEVRV